jgi:GntR family transcriptional regulator
MQFHLNPSDGMPIYKQIINQVKHMLGAGRLRPGDEMPSVRVLARQLLVNPNTVSRAYRDLEAMGLLVSRQGSGTFVTNAGSPLASREKLRLVTERADALLVEAQQLGFSLDHVKKLLDKRDAEMNAKGKKTA